MRQMRSTISVLVVFLLVLIAGVPTRAQHTITTVAGGGPNNLPALSSSIGWPCDVARDGAGNFYIADGLSSRIFKVDPAENLTIVAGNGVSGYSGDGGPATSAELWDPSGASVDTAGNIFIADTNNNRIREVVAATGVIQTVAGNGTQSYSGDGGPATSAGLILPSGVSVDTAGNIFIADTNNNRIRKVAAATGVINTIAGNGTQGYSGDGGPATSAELGGPSNVFVDDAGNIFIADSGNNRIREVVAATGVIQTVAGNGVFGYSGDGGTATSAELGGPSNVFVDDAGNIFIADSENDRIRQVVAVTGVVQTVAGNGTWGYSGDGGPATSAELHIFGNPGPNGGIFVDSAGNLFISDVGNSRIREVVAATGMIETVAGNGMADYSGDGGPATNAALSPVGVSVDTAGNIFIADTGNNRIRKVAAATGVINTIAGNGTQGYSGDGGPATSAELWSPTDVFVDSSGNIFIADYGNDHIREVVAATGNIQTVAGNGTWGYSGDGGPATSAEFDFPNGIAVDSAGNIFIADTYNNRIREVVAATGVIQTVAGNGTSDYSGDGGPATSAGIEYPTCVFVDSAGNIFFAAVGMGISGLGLSYPTSSRVREVVAATSMIQTVAGNGTLGYSGDGGPATSAQLKSPEGVLADDAGNIFIADTFNSRIREVVAATGVIQTVAGNGGTSGYSGDGGPATSAGLASPAGLAVDSSGDLLIADSGSQRIRSVSQLITILTGSLLPKSLSFGNQLVGTSSNAQSMTLTNTGGVALTISSIAVTGPNSGDFAQTNTCPASNSSLAVGANCTISVTFTPTATGNRSAAITIADDVGGTQSVSLTGMGTNFSLAAAAGGNCPSGGNCSTSATISAGQTATYDLQVLQLSGFNGTVALTCSGAPGASTCSVSPASVPPSGSSSYAFTVTVSNTSNVLVVPWLEFPLTPMLPALRIALLLLLTLLMLLLSWKGVAKKRTWRTLLPVLAVLLIGVMLSSSCGGGGGSGGSSQAPTNATLTITGTSGSVKHQLSLSLTVNH